jgi:hypothetical protein
MAEKISRPMPALHLFLSPQMPSRHRGALASLPSMVSLARRRLAPAETGPALRALCEWTPVDAPDGGVHPGDVGWYLRFDDAGATPCWARARLSPTGVRARSPS